VPGVGEEEGQRWSERRGMGQKKFQGEQLPPLTSCAYRKIALFSLFQWGGNGKKTEK